MGRRFPRSRAAHWRPPADRGRQACGRHHRSAAASFRRGRTFATRGAEGLRTRRLCDGAALVPACARHVAAAQAQRPPPAHALQPDRAWFCRVSGRRCSAGSRSLPPERASRRDVWTSRRAGARKVRARARGAGARVQRRGHAAGAGGTGHLPHNGHAARNPAGAAVYRDDRSHGSALTPPLTVRIPTVDGFVSRSNKRYDVVDTPDPEDTQAQTTDHHHVDATMRILNEFRHPFQNLSRRLSELPIPIGEQTQLIADLLHIQEEAEQLATQDCVTFALNRRGAYWYTDGRPVRSVAKIDMYDMRQANKVYGVAAVDTDLRRLSYLLRQIFSRPAGDFVRRSAGSDEFLVLSTRKSIPQLRRLIHQLYQNDKHDALIPWDFGVGLSEAAADENLQMRRRRIRPTVIRQVHPDNHSEIP